MRSKSCGSLTGNGVVESSSRSELTGTITRLVRRLPERNADVSQALFDFLMTRLEHVARARIAKTKQRFHDEEDLLAEVIGEFLMAGEQGELPPLGSREDVLKMLSYRLQQRAANMHRNETAAIRGGGQVRGDSAIGLSGSTDHPRGFDSFPGISPDPGDRLLRAEDLQEIYREIEAALDDPSLFRVYQLWGNGLTKDQIGQEIGLGQASVYRKLALILERLQSVYPDAILPKRL